MGLYNYNPYSYVTIYILKDYKYYYMGRCNVLYS